MPSWIPRLDLDTIRFGDAAYLWLLAPAGACCSCCGAGGCGGGAGTSRTSCAAASCRCASASVCWATWASGSLRCWPPALLIVALSRPQAVVSAVRQGSVDLVILQDASASMYVSDVPPDRWRRSIRFLRMLAESLRWQGDRVALALFAQLAAPQVRLTKDPNSLFFFIDTSARSRRSRSRTRRPGTPTSRKASAGACGSSRRTRSCSARAATRRRSS